MFPILYIRSIIKLWGKGKKLRESMFLSIYRVYNKRVYKGKKGAGQKVKNVRERVFLFCIDIVYNSIIEIGERKGAGQRYIEH